MSRLTTLPALASVLKDVVKPSVQMSLPLVAPPNENVPSASSPPLRNDGNVEYMIPLPVGTPGVPVPSVHESLTIHLMANCPAEFTLLPPAPAPKPLKMELFGAVAVS